MGIGNKPCLDIKPSADNIQDRFINIAVGNRGGMVSLVILCVFRFYRNTTFVCCQLNQTAKFWRKNMFGITLNHLQMYCDV